MVCYLHFRLGTLEIGSARAGMILSAERGSMFQKIRDNHMTTSDSFVSLNKGLELLLQRDHYAYFIGAQYVYAKEDYACKVPKISLICHMNVSHFRSTFRYFRSGFLDIRTNSHQWQCLRIHHIIMPYRIGSIK